MTLEQSMFTGRESDMGGRQGLYIGAAVVLVLILLLIFFAG